MKASAILSFSTGIIAYIVSSVLYNYYQHINGKNNKVVKALERLRKLSQKQDDYCQNGPKTIRLDRNRNFIVYMLPVCIIVCFFIYAFTQSLAKTLFILVLLVFIATCIAETISERGRNSFALQFRDWLYSINNSIKAGMSLEEAIRYSEKDIKSLHGKYKKATIVRCIQDTITYLNYGQPVSEALEAFKQIKYNQDVDAFIIAVKTIRIRGGNMAETISMISDMISEKVMLSREIDLMLYGKKLEGRIMVLIPLILVALIFFISPEYMEKMFNTPIGTIIYSVSFCMIAVGYLVSRKIAKIDVG